MHINQANKLKALDNAKRAPDWVLSLRCPRRIRTTTNRTKTCCATITPLDNVF